MNTPLQLPANSAFDPPFSFAFQPIADAPARAIVAWEALIRGPWDEPAWQVLNQVPPSRLHLFDQSARAQAVTLATRLGLDRPLHLNLVPRSLQSYPNAIAATLDAAAKAHLPVERLVLEVPEADVVDDRPRFASLMSEYRNLGIGLAIDDFGAAYTSLSVLADLEPDQIKLDMRLIRGIERHPPRQAIVRAILEACRGLHIHVIAEGVETYAEFAWLSEHDIRLFQGYFFSRPAFECFPPVHFPLPVSGPAADLIPRRPAAAYPMPPTHTGKLGL